jgi:uncharacterized protein YprB with RNaseH-like and TPR domain/predicted nuclease with RNAse H fold
MLTNTFQHIRGIGKKTEHALWQQGVLSWDDYVRKNNQQLALFNDPSTDFLQRSMEAYKRGDTDFFAACLPGFEYYRISLAYPEETLFLDIETTGLSLYYDQITIVGWSAGEKYGLFVRGGDPSELFQALQSAKVIVTFNGTLFDLKFLAKRFPDARIPSAHIDLRFLAKRIGLSGGQKIIEAKIGFKRPLSVMGMEGESAPILWYRYRRGDLEALKRLIRYNHSDIEGMKFILDHAISRIYEQDNIPKSLQSKAGFSKFKSKLKWAKTQDSGNPYAIHLTEYKEELKPLILYEQLNDIVLLSEKVIIGIDLVSSEERESGYCILRGNKAETFRIKADEEMIRTALDAKAHLVSIDSPLSLPKGRTSFFDDDPGRDQFGIMRECERILKKRGINVYPCLIPSMQKLTRRGIDLAGKFRRIGIPVIESYPGAAQDIIGIPRKRAGMEYLADALQEFGIICDFSTRKISHDELDAITSAIVGIFFWTGKFEAIGNPDEEYLIIPDLNAKPDTWIGRKVLGISGSNPKMKQIVRSHLSGAYSYCQIPVHKPVHQHAKTKLKALSSFQEKCPRTIERRDVIIKVIKEISKKTNILIEGLQFPEDHALLVEIFGPRFRHLHIETDSQATSLFSAVKEPELNLVSTYDKVCIKSDPQRIKFLADHVLIYQKQSSDLMSQLETALKGTGA